MPTNWGMRNDSGPGPNYTRCTACGQKQVFKDMCLNCGEPVFGKTDRTPWKSLGLESVKEFLTRYPDTQPKSLPNLIKNGTTWEARETPLGEVYLYCENSTGLWKEQFNCPLNLESAQHIAAALNKYNSDNI